MTASGYVATRYGGTGRNYVLSRQNKMKKKVAAKKSSTGGRSGLVKRVKRVTRTRTSTRYATRRKRTHKKAYTSDPQGSTFVKCTDTKLPDVKRYITPFQRKVLMATMPQFALKVLSSEFSFMCKAGPYGSSTTLNQIVGWNQIAINALNPEGSFNSNSSSGWNRLVCSSFHTDLVSAQDPFGLQRQGWSGSGTNSNVDYLPPTLYTNTSNMLFTDVSQFNANSNMRLWQGDTYVTLEMRNPQPYGVRANIYEVGARAKQEIFHTSTSAAGFGATTYNFPNIGSPSFSNGSVSVDYMKTPLETFIMGMARKGVNQTAVPNSRTIGLNDSPDFVDAFRTYKVCNVYIPPGGTLYKSYKIGSRFLDYTHIKKNTYDKSTKFLVIKTVPEVQNLPRATITGTVIGVPNDPGDANNYWYDSTTAGSHLICTLTQRVSMRILPSVLRADTYQQYGWIPAGASLYEGRYIAQNNDQGSDTLKGVLTNPP